MIRKLSLFIFIIISASARSQALKPEIPVQERERTYDVQHIKISVNFDQEKKTVYGNVETRITPLSDGMKEFEVDAVAFNINSVRDEKNNGFKYDYDGKKIKIYTEKNYTISDTILYTVDYTCQPQKGLHFIYPTELNPSLPYQIWTQGESDENRNWLPVYDYPNDKTTFEIYITVDKKYKTLSNGVLQSSKKIFDTEKRLDHWVMDKPNSTYLIMLAVGDFNVIENKFNDLPVLSYFNRNVKPDEAEYTFKNTPEMIKVFSDKYQHEYPWNKYAQLVVEDFVYGGMENTTVTVLNKRLIYNSEIENDYTGDGTISHELAHQWWGDLTTCRNWNEMWLNEGFATYSEALWKEDHLGRDEYDYEIMRDGDAALRMDSVRGRYPIWGGYGSFATNIYDKGAVIIHSFRNVLGDDFFPAMATFLKDNEYKNVESQDLINAINKSYNSRHNSNENFKWMFDQWIWKAGSPNLQIKYDYDEQARKLVLNIKQIQIPDSLTPVFRLPVYIRVKSVDADKTERIEISQDDQTFRIDLGTKPEMVVFDQGNNILDKSFFDKPFPDWKNQFELSENAIDRIMALRGLELFLKDDNSSTAGKPPITIDQISALRIFDNALNDDKFWGVRASAAMILANNFIIDRTGTILKNSYDNQTDSRIKREILKALGNSKRSEDIDFIKEKIKNETNNYILADGILSLAKGLEPDKIFDAVSPYANIDSHRGVVQDAVVDALVISDTAGTDQRAKKIIMDIAFGIDVEGRLRAATINSLKKYARDEDVKTIAMKYADINCSFVKSALINLLGNSKDKNIIPFLKDMNEKTNDDDMIKIILSAIRKLENSN